MANISNRDRGALVSGTDEDNNIYNSGTYSTIVSGSGDDSIDNVASNVLIQSGDGNDGIFNRSGTKVTIESAEGDDIINSYSSITMINSGAGDDYIYTHSGNKVTVDGGEGDDTIISGSQRTSIYGGDGDDLIYVTGNSTTINGGGGNDTIYASRYVETFQYSEGDGDDLIVDYKTVDAIRILNGSIDSATVEGSDFIIKVGSGSVTIKDAINTKIKMIDSNGAITFLNPGDYITSGIDSATISGTDVADTITNGDSNAGYNTGSNATISAGGGEDKITNRGSDVYIDAGTGNDTINNTGAGSLIVGGEGNDSIKTKGDSVTAYGNEGDDYIYNGLLHSDYSSLSGGSGNDTLKNYGAYSLVDGVEDNDNIYNDSRAIYSVINGGEGSDTIRNAASFAMIYGGSGDDSINTSGENVTINAGIGDDLIRCSTGTNTIIYAEGDGNDTLFGYKSTDTINLTSGSVTKSAVNGADVLLYIGEDGSESQGIITIKNAKEKKITITDSEGNTTSQVYEGTQEYNEPDGIIYNNNKTAVTVQSPFEGIINLYEYSKVKHVDARQTDGAVLIIGNSQANVFRAGSGGSTLSGGGGTDALYGGDGADTFVYSKGDGKDTIYKYTSGQDDIVLSSDTVVTGVSIRGTSVILKFDDGGTLTVASAKGKALTITDAEGTTADYTFTKDSDGLVSTSDDDTLTASYSEKFLFEDEILTDEILNIDLDSLNLNDQTADYAIENINLISTDFDDLKINSSFNDQISKTIKKSKK